MLTRPRRRPDHESDGGFTLIEMLVVMSLSTLLMIMVGKGFLSSFQTMTQAQSRSEATVRVQNALEAVSRDVRVADCVTSGASTGSCSPVSGDSRTLAVNLVRSGHCLQRTWALPATGSPATVTSTTVTYSTATCGTGTTTTTTNNYFLSNVDNNRTSTAVFAYTDASGVTSTATAAAEVKIRFIVAPKGGGTVSLSTIVQLRNAL